MAYENIVSPEILRPVFFFVPFPIGQLTGGTHLSEISSDYQRFTRFTPNYTPKNVKFGIMFKLLKRQNFLMNQWEYLVLLNFSKLQ